MSVLHKLLSSSVEKLVTIPLDCIFSLVLVFEAMLSEVLLSAGRPTPAQCATLQLTHRVKELRDKETMLRKETETYRDQLTKVKNEKDLLEDQLQRAEAQRDQAITDTAWFSLSATALTKNACLFLAGVVVSYAWQADISSIFFGRQAPPTPT